MKKKKKIKFKINYSQFLSNFLKYITIIEFLNKVTKDRLF